MAVTDPLNLVDDDEISRIISRSGRYRKDQALMVASFVNARFKAFLKAKSAPPATMAVTEIEAPVLDLIKRLEGCAQEDELTAFWDRASDPTGRNFVTQRASDLREIVRLYAAAASALTEKKD